MAMRHIKLIAAAGALTGLALAAQAQTINLLGDYPRVHLKCPASVTEGGDVTLTVTVENYSCTDPLKVSRAIGGMFGNAGGTVAALGIWGPYKKSVSVNAPVADCDEDGDVLTPGKWGPTSIKVMNAPTGSGLANTAATVYFGLLSTIGQLRGTNACMTVVVP
jgi:hypothetical protein